MRPGENGGNVTFINGFKNWKDITFLEILTLLEIYEIDKFKSLKAVSCPFLISLKNLFPESTFNDVNYQICIKEIVPSEPSQHD